MSDIANGLKAIRLQWLDRLREFLDSEVVAKPGHPKRIGILGALGTGDVGDEAMLIAGAAPTVSLAVYFAVPAAYFVLITVLRDRPATATDADDFS